MTLEQRIRGKLYAAQRRMSEIEGDAGYVPSSYRYEYQQLVREASKRREQLELLTAKV